VAGARKPVGNLKSINEWLHRSLGGAPGPGPTDTLRGKIALEVEDDLARFGPAPTREQFRDVFPPEILVEDAAQADGVVTLRFSDPQVGRYDNGAPAYRCQCSIVLKQRHKKDPQRLKVKGWAHTVHGPVPGSIMESHGSGGGGLPDVGEIKATLNKVWRY
jgi:hypothetical protein